MNWKAIIALVLCAAAFGGAGPVLAQYYAPYGVQGPFKKGPPPQPMPAKQEDRDQRAGPAPGRPPFERMSPEERGQLRRDIERHGREIYPDPRRERRR